MDLSLGAHTITINTFILLCQKNKDSAVMNLVASSRCSNILRIYNSIINKSRYATDSNKLALMFLLTMQYDFRKSFNMLLLHSALFRSISV